MLRHGKHLSDLTTKVVSQEENTNTQGKKITTVAKRGMCVGNQMALAIKFKKDTVLYSYQKGPVLSEKEER